MTTSTRATSDAVDTLLAAVLAGDGAAARSVLADDAVLDATVPGWRFSRRGAAAIADQYRGWFDAPGRFEELERQPTPTGEVVTYLVASQDRGVPYAARHCHVLTIDATTGKITRDQFFCGGRWDAASLAAMAEAEATDHAG